MINATPPLDRQVLIKVVGECLIGGICSNRCPYSDDADTPCQTRLYNDIHKVLKLDLTVIGIMNDRYTEMKNLNDYLEIQNKYLKEDNEMMTNKLLSK